MNEPNVDAESVTKNKTYNSMDHLCHLLKIGWGPHSQLVKKFMLENNLSDRDLKEAMSKVNDLSKDCCIVRNSDEKGISDKG